MNKKINDQIKQMVEDIEKPTWKQPWISRAKCNFITGRPYHGGNAFMVSAVDEDFFLTYKQAVEIGHVKQGSKGLPIGFYSMIEDETGEERPVMTAYYTIFRLSDIEVKNSDKFEKLMQSRKQSFEVHEIPDMDELVKATGAEVCNDPARAFYLVGGNAVFVPEKGQFKDTKDYYRTIFHELGHWTGKALERNQKNRFGSADYAAEELVAEVFSIYVCESFGMDVNQQSAHYIKGWLKALKNDPQAIFSAFSEAEKAYQYIEKLIA